MKKDTRNYCKVQKFKDGGMVKAKSELAKALRERDAYLNDPDIGILERDRREATMNSFSSGDYSKGSYRPFEPKRGDD